MKRVLPLLGLVLAACTSAQPRRDPTGEPLPSVRAETLAGEALRLPENLAGLPALLLVGYVQDAQFDADRWLFGLLQAQTPVRVLEVPTIPGLAKLFAERIDGGMRAGIPDEDWSAVATVYGEGAGEIARFTGSGGRNVRVLLLDPQGRVAFFHDEGFSAGTLVALDRAARALAR